MGRHRQAVALQGKTMEQYIMPAPVLQHQTRLGGTGDGLSTPATTEEPSRAEILAAIQGSRVALEGKIETVVVEVNLFRADLRKVSDKVKVAEGSILELHTEMCSSSFSYARGVTISVAPGVTFTHVYSEVGVKGRYVLVEGTLDESPITILNTYDLNTDDHSFYARIPDPLEDGMDVPIV
ncbi:hypothetical protein NDU88_001669 [Pleurodeles waltl]|uniref:Uncharacterized protein n=1 Tax=Pleurodeles waltl TaxID=8319 RepID=A0AAV7UVC8_PLEWA|nr:hypothetical protein NDU88_001669 [Pleurodeles waltl]